MGFLDNITRPKLGKSQYKAMSASERESYQSGENVRIAAEREEKHRRAIAPRRSLLGSAVLAAREYGAKRQAHERALKARRRSRRRAAPRYYAPARRVYRAPRRRVRRRHKRNMDLW